MPGTTANETAEIPDRKANKIVMIRWLVMLFDTSYSFAFIGIDAHSTAPIRCA